MRISDWSSDVCSSDLLVEKLDRDIREVGIAGEDGPVDLRNAHLDPLTRPVADRRQLHFATKLCRCEPPDALGAKHAPALLGRRPVGDLGRGRRLHPLFLNRSEEHTSELQSLMRISYAGF